MIEISLKEVLKDVQAKMSKVDIGKKYNLSAKDLKKLFDFEKIKEAYKEVTHVEVTFKQIKDLFDEGVPRKEIAKKLGVSILKVNKLMEENNMKGMRPPSAKSFSLVDDLGEEQEHGSGLTEYEYSIGLQ